MSNLEKICASCGSGFYISENDLEFYRKISPKFGETVCEIPAPTHCPQCRQQRRMRFRNFTQLYRRPGRDGQPVISMYHAEQPFPILPAAEWWRDDWDAREFGRPFDFSKTFAEQYHALSAVVPRFQLAVTSCENCDFCNLANDSRDSYLSFGCVDSESCYYSHIVWHSRDCLDCAYVFRAELCAHSVDLVDCYGVHFSSECVNCTDSYFLYDCRGCRDCFGCTNLRNRQYCFCNEQLTKAEYEQKVADLLPLTPACVAECDGWLAAAKQTAVSPSYFGSKNEDVIGNHIYESAQLYYCFDAKKCEDASYLFTAFGCQNSHDLSFTSKPVRWCYDSLTLMTGTENCCFSHFVGDSHDIFYSEFCHGSAHLFGCNGLKRAEYCILNKQYSKAEYEELVPKIIAHMRATGEWGEFFPVQLSPFAYNETVANEYFPLSREEVAARGWRWRESEESELNLTNAVVASELPESIVDVTDDILKLPIICEVSGRPFKIQKAELAFYRQMQLPLPRRHPDVRHRDRLARRNPRALWPRACAECGTEIYTSFAPDRPERVACESCYQKAVY